MVRSGRAAGGLAWGFALSCGLALTACVSTRQTAAWIQLNDARIRASEHPVRVTSAARSIEVVGIQALRQGSGTAFVVAIRNLRRTAVSDLAVSVGLRGHDGRVRYLNAAAGLPYYDAHVPGIAAGQTLRWVYMSGRPLAPGEQPVALVGEGSVAAPAPAGPLPAITTRVLRRSAGGVSVRVSNSSGVPQYQLQVYGYAQRSDRYLAAAGASIPILSPGASATVRIGLPPGGGAELRLEAPASMLQ